MQKKHKGLALLAAALVTAQNGRLCNAQQKECRNRPAGASPQVIGKRVAENFIVRKYRAQSDPIKAHLGIIYPEVCTWYGALTVAQLTGDKELQTRLIKKFDQLMTPPDSSMISQSPHADFRVFGTVPLEIYLQTKGQKYLELGKSFADRQWDNTTPDGITTEARYWIDDMIMVTAVQVQAYRATGEAKYNDRAALAMAAYLDKLRQPKWAAPAAGGSRLPDSSCCTSIVDLPSRKPHNKSRQSSPIHRGCHLRRFSESKKRTGRSWQLQDAKNRLSQLIESARSYGPQTITLRGKPTAVVVSFEDYARLVQPQLSLVEFLRRSPLCGVELQLERSRDTGREIEL